MRVSRGVLAFAFLLVAMLAEAMPVGAGSNWCEGDPVFGVGGNVIDVSTSFPSEYADALSGPVNFELQVPSNALLPVVISLDGSVPVTGKVTRSLPAYYGLLSMPVRLRVWMDSSKPFTTYTRVTGVTAWGRSVTLLNTVAGSSTSVQQYQFSLPLY